MARVKKLGPKEKRVLILAKDICERLINKKPKNADDMDKQFFANTGHNALDSLLGWFEDVEAEMLEEEPEEGE